MTKTEADYYPDSFNYFVPHEKKCTNRIWFITREPWWNRTESGSTSTKLEIEVPQYIKTTGIVYKQSCHCLTTIEKLVPSMPPAINVYGRSRSEVLRPIPASRLWPKKWKFWMATAPGAKRVLSTIFWLVLVLPVGVKTYRSSKIKFFVKVKNNVHVTNRNVFDFAWNWFLHQNDFNVKKILMCYRIFYWVIHRWWTTYIKTIPCTSYGILSSGFLLMQYFYMHVCAFWCNVFVTFVTSFVI